MKYLKLLFICTVFSSLVFYACKEKTDDPAPGNSDKCASKSITVTADITNTIKCDKDGKLIIRARGSSGFTYQLNAGVFQSDSTFSNLAGGTYNVTVKDADGCTKSASFVVAETGSKGPTFTPVASMIGAKCNLACHNTGQDGAPIGIFSTDCNIVIRSALIKTKAYDGSMGNLNAGEKNQILTWINAGGGYTD